MNDHTSTRRPILNGWRIAGWGSLLALLMLPAFAMQFTPEVLWTASDFLFAALLLGSLGAGVEIALRFNGGLAEKLGIIAGAFAGFITIWVTGAVGIIGNEGQAINLAFPALVLAAGIASAIVRLRKGAMLVILAAMCASMLAIGLAAELTGQPDWGPVLFMAIVWLVPTLFYVRATAS